MVQIDGGQELGCWDFVAEFMDLQQPLPSNVSEQGVTLVIDVQLMEIWHMHKFLDSMCALKEGLKFGNLKWAKTNHTTMFRIRWRWRQKWRGPTTTGWWLSVPRSFRFLTFHDQNLGAKGQQVNESKSQLLMGPVNTNLATKILWETHIWMIFKWLSSLIWPQMHEIWL